MRLLPALLALLLVGCAERGPDPKAEAARMDRARTMRTLFDRAKGDYAALSPEDRTAFVRLYEGDEAKAQQAWKIMRDGPGAAR